MLLLNKIVIHLTVILVATTVMGVITTVAKYLNILSESMTTLPLTQFSRNQYSSVTVILALPLALATQLHVSTS
jgi:hypothetical protein